MNKFVSGLGVTALGVAVLGFTLAWSTTVVSPGERVPICGSIEQAHRLMDRSRNGIAVSCAQFLSEHARRNVESKATAKGASQ